MLSLVLIFLLHKRPWKVLFEDLCPQNIVIAELKYSVQSMYQVRVSIFVESEGYILLLCVMT